MGELITPPGIGEGDGTGNPRTGYTVIKINYVEDKPGKKDEHPGVTKTKELKIEK